MVQCVIEGCREERVRSGRCQLHYDRREARRKATFALSECTTDHLTTLEQARNAEDFEELKAAVVRIALQLEGP